MKNILLFIVLILIVAVGWNIASTWVIAPKAPASTEVVRPAHCQDSTPDHYCSQDRPMYCMNGTLTSKPSLCGCPDGQVVKGESCYTPTRCQDGTIEGQCSSRKPYICQHDGGMTVNASICGCPANYEPDGENCVSSLKKGPVVRSFSYVLRSAKEEISGITLYKGISDMVASIPRTYVCNPTCPSDSELALREINQPEQLENIRPLADAIYSMSQVPDERARIAISLVQQIPYNQAGFLGWDSISRYPYEVLYEYHGVCGEKSHLLALLLRELGYGTVLMRFSAENHMTVGIKCPVEYSFRGSGYCFIESTKGSIVTDDQGDYGGDTTLSSNPELIFISDGRSFDSVKQEYDDARAWQQIRSGPEVVDAKTYAEYKELKRKYGIP
jgi:hypothetical protein